MEFPLKGDKGAIEEAMNACQDNKMTAYAKFMLKIIDLSHEKTFPEVIDEWKLVDHNHADEWEKCLCGHRIKQVFYLFNQMTKVKVKAGNCCITAFNSNWGRVCARYLRADKTNNLKDAEIDFAYTCKMINKWEYEFLNDTYKRKHFSDKQANMIAKLTKKIRKDAYR